jgi:hypothetical protein
LESHGLQFETKCLNIDTVNIATGMARIFCQGGQKRPRGKLKQGIQQLDVPGEQHFLRGGAAMPLYTVSLKRINIINIYKYIFIIKITNIFLTNNWVIPENIHTTPMEEIGS